MLGRHPSLQVGNAAPGSAIFSDYIMLADRVRVDVDFGGYRLEDTRWSGRTAQFVRPQTIASARPSTHTSVVLLNEEAEEVGTGAGVFDRQHPIFGDPPSVHAHRGVCSWEIIWRGRAVAADRCHGAFRYCERTDDFRKARGEAILTVLSPTLQDAVFDLRLLITA
jgi:hypothetical protein